jgi:hypothetical protein
MAKKRKRSPWYRSLKYAPSQKELRRIEEDYCNWLASQRGWTLEQVRSYIELIAAQERLSTGTKH